MTMFEFQKHTAWRTLRQGWVIGLGGREELPQDRYERKREWQQG